MEAGRLSSTGRSSRRSFECRKVIFAAADADAACVGYRPHRWPPPIPRGPPNEIQSLTTTDLHTFPRFGSGWRLSTHKHGHYHKRDPYRRAERRFFGASRWPRRGQAGRNLFHCQRDRPIDRSTGENVATGDPSIGRSSITVSTSPVRSGRLFFAPSRDPSDDSARRVLDVRALKLGVRSRANHESGDTRFSGGPND